ncbi:MAG: MFS transporter [Planctomycetota bacterium]|jgi:multidrug resistance protein
MKRSALGVLFLTVVVDLLGFGIVLPLLPRYAEIYRANGAEIGLLFASFSAMQFLCAPFWGRLSDRYGRRPLLMLGLFGSVLSYLLFAFADSYTMLLVSRIAAGVFGATIGTAQAYIADVTGHEDRGKQMALIGAAFGVGFTLGPSIGGLADHYLGQTAPGLFAAGLSLVAFLMAWRSLPEPERHLPPRLRPLLDTTAIRHSVAISGVPLILTLAVVVTFCFAVFEGTLARFTVRWGYDIRENGFIFTYVGACLLIAQGLVVRRLMGRVGEVNFSILGSLLLSAGLAGVAMGEALTAIFMLPVAVLGYSMLSPSLASLLSRRTPAEMQGEMLGLNQSGLALARILGPWIGNVLFDLSPETPYWGSAAIMLLAFLAAFGLKRR